jgi:hypothetical protein
MMNVLGGHVFEGCTWISWNLTSSHHPRSPKLVRMFHHRIRLLRNQYHMHLVHGDGTHLSYDGALGRPIFVVLRGIRVGGIIVRLAIKVDEQVLILTLRQPPTLPLPTPKPSSVAHLKSLNDLSHLILSYNPAFLSSAALMLAASL